MKLDSGQIICDKCNGCGNVIVEYKIDNVISTKEFEVKELCPKCKGWGKLDWVDNVFGRKHSNCSHL